MRELGGEFTKSNKQAAGSAAASQGGWRLRARRLRGLTCARCLARGLTAPGRRLAWVPLGTGKFRLTQLPFIPGTGPPSAPRRAWLLWGQCPTPGGRSLCASPPPPGSQSARGPTGSERGCPAGVLVCGPAHDPLSGVKWITFPKREAGASSPGSKQSCRHALNCASRAGRRVQVGGAVLGGRGPPSWGASRMPWGRC